MDTSIVPRFVLWVKWNTLRWMRYGG